MPKFRKGIPPPVNRNPLVVRLVELMNEQEVDTIDLCESAGVSHTSIHSWRVKSNPNIANLEAVLNVLGYTLAIVKLEDVQGV